VPKAAALVLMWTPVIAAPANTLAVDPRRGGVAVDVIFPSVVPPVRLRPRTAYAFALPVLPLLAVSVTAPSELVAVTKTVEAPESNASFSPAASRRVIEHGPTGKQRFKAAWGSQSASVT
jgi:hypothetical protein